MADLDRIMRVEKQLARGLSDEDIRDILDTLEEKSEGKLHKFDEVFGE